MPKNHRKQRHKRASTSASRDVGDLRDGCSEQSGWRHGKSQKGRNEGGGVGGGPLTADVTLQAYADNADGRALGGRLSKAAATVIAKEFRHIESASAVLEAAQEEEVIDDWYERAMSDEDGQDDVIVDDVEVKEDTEEKSVEKHRVSNTTDALVTCRVHLSVIWYLVSDYIRPEDVATFACLCRDAYAVTNTAGFWRRLFYRYHTRQSCDKLPRALHRTSMERTYGLRSLVVRSLQFIYRPFVECFSPRRNMISQNAVERLSNVAFMYHVRRRDHPNYVYYLKFQQMELLDPRRLKAVTDGLNRNEDICYNAHQGQCILMVVCKQTHHLEPERIMGKELASASLSVSSGMTHNKLRLLFQEPRLRKTNRGRKGERGAAATAPALDHRTRSELTEVVLDPVVSARVFNWWHPLFHEEFRMRGNRSSSQANHHLNMWNANAT